MPTTLDRNLPLAGSRGLCPAGEGPRLDRERRAWDSFPLQLLRWCIKIPADPLARRLWNVVIRPKETGRRKIERTLPTGRRIRIFEPGLATRYPHRVRGTVEGPVYYLTFVDAEQLWRDKDVALWPARDRIVVDAEKG